MHPTLQRQRGAVAIMVAVYLVLVLAMAGLVIDGGLAYLVKARLNAAVDAAAVAGARAVTTGNTEAQQRLSAQTAAQEFFDANIPSTYMLSKPKLVSTTVGFNGGMVTVDVKAEAPMPVSLMQVMGSTSMAPVASAQTIRKDLDMAFVVDTSGSLRNSAAGVRTAAKSFLSKFNVTQDRVSLIHFAYGAEVDKPINLSDRGFDRTSMNSKIDNYVFDGSTASVEGMWNARDQLKSILPINRSSLRVIVFFSDGVPNALGSYLNFNNQKDCTTAGVLDNGGGGLYNVHKSRPTSISSGCTLYTTYDSYNYSISDQVKSLPAAYNAHGLYADRDDVSKHEFPIETQWPRAVTRSLANDSIASQNILRAARNLPEAIAAKARDEGIFVFTLGMGNDLKVASALDKEVGENILKCMANVADGPAHCYNPAKPVGMYCYAATEADLTPCFSRLASAILRISK